LCTWHLVAAIQQSPLLPVLVLGPHPNALLSGARATCKCPAVLVPGPHPNALLSELCQAALASQVVRMCLFTGEAADAVHSASAAIGTLCEGAVDRRLMQ